MSKFIAAIRHGLTGRRKAIYEPLSVTFVKSDTAADFSCVDEYKFEVVWRVIASCKREDLDATFKNVVRELQEAVYGQFRDRVIRLERAVYEQDREKVLMHTRDLVREVML